MILNLQHIYKDYNQDKLVVPVLKDVSLQVEEGEYVAIMGPSGSGKTTLMNIIGCLDRPTSGTYELAGKDVLNLKDREMSAVRLNSIGFVFQSFQLMPRESALDNVSLPLSYAGVKKKERKERAQKALERVGLGDRSGFRPTQLSGGQKKRVALARTLVNPSDVLILDEPTAALDPYGRDEILSILEDLHRKKNITILLVSHSMDEVARFAQRIIVMDKGEILMDGTPADIFRRHKELEEIGLAAPQAMYIMKELKKYGLPVDTEIFTPQEAVKEINRIRDGAEQR